MKLENARGTRDYLPEEKIARDRIVDTLRNVFETFGYSPLETPALERFDVLSSKYAGGSEILKETFKLIDQGKRELGMRYDLTVPLSRVVGQNPNLKFPFKRYQIEKVWRDGPVGPGRYREFLQADVDIIGVKNVAAEAELIEIALVAFERLGLDIVVKFNNRKILNAILDFAGVPQEKHDATILTIDKLDKIGKDELKKELEQAVRLDEGQVKKLLELIIQPGKNEQKVVALRLKLKGAEAEEAIKEIEDLLAIADFENVIFDVSLARGLSYYTGTVFEAVLNDNKIKSSVAGGGRYDRMIGALLGQAREYPAVGISFGVDRIFAALDKGEKDKTVTKIFVIPIKTYKESLEITRKLREAGIKADMDMQGKGPSRNLDYANSLGIPYALFVGGQEIQEKKFKLKDMKSGKEELLGINEVIDRLKS
ncbi:MAG: histidyl-tRNA synthetase [archaeon GW2011_AR3]|nr:MAG: histidyl-tRNA synthetase [archaeon GW2011_AR3]MBS3110064.1 histidine--tRNA ligase [Candidatus Woesearchaeota archaeon]